MTETTSTPPRDEQPEDDGGTFVGGTFGSREDEQTTTAGQVEGADEGADDRAAPAASPESPESPESPAPAEELLSGPAQEPQEFPSDVEGTTAEPAPGDRNEPI